LCKMGTLLGLRRGGLVCLL
nr:immunoglobulin heavy chain junction region [Mus musculus]